MVEEKNNWTKMAWIQYVGLLLIIGGFLHLVFFQGLDFSQITATLSGDISAIVIGFAIIIIYKTQKGKVKKIE